MDSCHVADGCCVGNFFSTRFASRIPKGFDAEVEEGSCDQVTGVYNTVRA